MKKLHCLAASVVLAFTSFGASAQKVLPFDSLPKSGVAMTAADLPPGFGTGFELLRMYNNREKNHFTYGHLPSNWGDLGWKVEGTLGRISGAQFENSHQLFYCWMRSTTTGGRAKNFTSTDGNCEGWEIPTAPGYFIGWISTVQAPGSVPLYRCYIELTKDHFDTLTTNCEGEVLAKREYILGYVFL
ncbi:hypothetical protein [Xanthomonas bonasiae]|uniref:hypothetical protein n=1 Tax=Xanthomonas bonasiae TaxID=2810351 RepID=UPI00197FA3BB|nr:hypothetical protein [Xanthomonas bonasiae]MBN6111292.1 hypothetical protein [Xanthomonas bonasiae]